MILALFWQAVFWGSFAAFTVVSVLITVKGVRELQELFRALGPRDRG